MSKKKLLYLNSIITILNEDGHKKIEEARKKSKYKNSDEESMWERLGIPAPDEHEEENNEVVIGEDHTENVITDVVIDLDEFVMCMDSTDGETSTIYLKSGHTVDIIDMAEEVYSQIEYLNRNIFEIIRDKIKVKYYRFRNKYLRRSLCKSK